MNNSEVIEERDKINKYWIDEQAIAIIVISLLDNVAYSMTAPFMPVEL